MFAPIRLLVALILTVSFVGSAWAQRVEPVPAKPLDQVVTAKKGPVASGKLRVPTITWGGDVATVLAHDSGAFRAAGLDVELYCENDFAKAVGDCIGGKTPFVRGTMGMVNAAAPACQKAGVELVVIYQLTWSTGGDAMVVRGNVRKPQDLSGATIAAQLYGPHMDYLANILTTAGVDLNKVKYQWYRDLFPPEEPGDVVSDPVSAFAASDQINACMAIIPDALRLTSDGTVGTGAEGSVSGAKILLSTKTASRVIADVYAVRRDWLEANRGQAESFVKTLMVAEESLRDVRSNPAKKSDLQKLLASSATLLLGAAEATADVEGMLADCEFVGYDGNVSFFTGQGTTRKFETLVSEIQTSFQAMRLMTGPAPLAKQNWDYAKLRAGLRFAGQSGGQPRFDSSRAAAKVEEELSAELDAWEDDTLFVIEITFGPNQSTFPIEDYRADFQKALDIAQTYGGAIVIVEGHSDPLGVLRARKEGRSPAEVSQLEQVAKNLSLARSNAVRNSYLEYCKDAGIAVDDSQFVAVGVGVAAPKFNPPRTKAEWDANRRVVFRIKQVEAELGEFVPLE